MAGAPFCGASGCGEAAEYRGWHPKKERYMVVCDGHRNPLTNVKPLEQPGANR